MPSMDLTPEEARHIRRRRDSEKRDGYYRQGLEAAAAVVEQMVEGEAAAAPIVEAIMACKRPRKKDRKEPPLP